MSPTGIEVRHRRGCASPKGGRCSCRPGYRATVYSAADRKRLTKTFPTLAAAKAWRADAMVALRRGTLRAAPTSPTLRDAAGELIDGMATGAVRTRSGDVFKPSTRRAYETMLRQHVLPRLGAVKVSDIARRDLQRLADDLVGRGLDASSVRNALMPLRVIYRRAVEVELVTVNPTDRLRLPAVRGKRDRIATPDEAAELITAIPVEHRALWATAFYAGLRRGELMALRWEDVDLATGIVRVERGWDDLEGPVEPKSRAGRRAIPVAPSLRDHLLEHRMRTRRTDGLVFGQNSSQPFAPTNVRDRALVAWRRANKARLEADANAKRLEPITLHEARHTFASLMIAAGVGAKALAVYMGHSSISITLDRYGHLFPSALDEDAARLESYLARANTTGRLAQLD